MLPQLPTRVVQRLVQGIAVRAQTLGEYVDRDAVQGERDEHATLVWRQNLLDRALEHREQLALLGTLARLELAARKQAPRLRLERDLAPLPGAPPQLHRRLEQRKLVDPRREAARAAEVVEAREHAHERVVRRFQGDLLQLVSPQVRQRRPAPGDLEPRRAQKERVQARDRVLAR